MPPPPPLLPEFIRRPDPLAWAALHAVAPQATVYTAGWWLDEVTRAAWGAVVVPDGRGGYAAALPVPLRRRWRGLGHTEAFQPFFTQQLGVLSAPAAAASSAADALAAAPDAALLLAALPAGLRAYGQLHYSNRLAVPPPGFTVGGRLTHHLALTPGYAALAAGFQQNHRRNLKKAQALVISTENEAAAQVIALFRATKGAALPAVKPRHYALLGRLAAGLHERRQLRVLVARAPDTAELLAGGVFAQDARQLIYLVGGVSAAGRAVGAMHAVIDGLLRAEAGHGRLLDFEGSMVESVARFYAGFGARPVTYLTFQRP